jgi:hypothetical protein
MNLLDLAPFIAFLGAAILVAELLARASTRPPRARRPRHQRPHAPRRGAHAPPSGSSAAPSRPKTQAELR